MQMDCFRVVSEIKYLFGKIKSYTDTIDCDDRMIQVTHMALVTSHYLQSFVVANAEFHATPPAPYKCRHKGRSMWHY